MMPVEYDLRIAEHRLHDLRREAAAHREADDARTIAAGRRSLFDRLRAVVRYTGPTTRATGTVEAAA